MSLSWPRTSGARFTIYETGRYAPFHGPAELQIDALLGGAQGTATIKLDVTPAPVEAASKSNLTVFKEDFEDTSSLAPF